MTQAGDNLLERAGQRALVHAGAGIGNLVLATPLLVALDHLNFRVDLWLSADYPDTASLLQNWSIVRRIYSRHREIAFRRYDALIPAIPPFYWHRYAHHYAALPNVVSRPPNALFYEDEQAYYLAFVHALGLPQDLKPTYRLPIAASTSETVSLRTLAIAPGCKTGEMAAKRWPYYAELADRFEDVAVFGTDDDLRNPDGTYLGFSRHVKMLVEKLTLRETAEHLAAAGIVVGNDSGLSHVAAATGTPTIMLFGPTPDRSLGRLPPNVTVLRAGLGCEPCWFGERLTACDGKVECLKQISADAVAASVVRILGTNGKDGGR